MSKYTEELDTVASANATDVIAAVRDPGGTPADIQLTAQQIARLNTLSEITINVIGDSFVPPNLLMIQPCAMQAKNVVTFAPGKWVEFLGVSNNFPWSNVTELGFPDLVGVKGNLSIHEMESLTTLALGALVIVGGRFLVNTLPAMEIFNIPNLRMLGGSFEIGTFGSLATLALSSLTVVNGSFSPYELPALVALDISGLERVVGNFEPANMALLETLSAPALVFIGNDVQLYSLPSLTALGFPVLEEVLGNFHPFTLNALESIELPSIKRIGNDITINQDLDALTTFTLGPGLIYVGGNVDCGTSPALNEASVDNVLVRLAALDGTGATTSYDNHMVELSGNCAPPSAAGLTAKAALQGRGNTVTVNS